MAAQQPQQGQPRQPRQPQQPQQYGPPYAGLGARAGAVIIDGILVFIASIIIAVAAAGVEGLQLFSGLIGLAYFIGMEGANDGQTVGKMALGIKVTTETGEEIDFVAATIRTLLRIIDGLFLYLVGAIIISVNDENKRLGDIVASTVVVDADAAPAGGQGYQQGGQQQYQQGGQQQYQQGGQQQGGYQQGGQQQGGQQQGGYQQGGQQQGGQQGGWDQGGQQGNQQDDGWS